MQAGVRGLHRLATHARMPVVDHRGRRGDPRGRCAVRVVRNGGRTGAANDAWRDGSTRARGLIEFGVWNGQQKTAPKRGERLQIIEEMK